MSHFDAEELFRIKYGLQLGRLLPHEQNEIRLQHSNKIKYFHFQIIKCY